MQGGSNPERPERPKDRVGKLLGAAVAASIAVSLLAGLVGFAMTLPSASAAAVSFTLYGDFVGGWGFTPGGETNPGPTITVNEGDSVTMRLISEDGTDHGLLIDYNGNGFLDPGIDYSSVTGLDVTFTFTASQPGTFLYFCSIHSGPPYSSTSPMRGTWITNGLPKATFAAPLAGASWTGGSSHDIVFDLADEDTTPSLTFWVNYSYNGGANRAPIVGPVTGSSNPITVPWTPSGFTATDVRIEVESIDSTGAKGLSASVAFEVDSTPPTIASRSPAPDAVGVSLNSQVRVVWSEPMDAVATRSPATFGLERTADSEWIPGTIALAPNRTLLTFTPSAPLDTLTMYEVHVNASAKDDSSPGNAFAGPENWRFTTGTAADTIPPAVAGVLATPSAVEVGDPVNLTAAVTDNDAVAAVSAHVVGPSTDVNRTMARGPGTTYFVEDTFLRLGSYTVTVWAQDSSGNSGSGSGGFTVEDTIAPTVASATGVPASAAPGGSVNVTAAVQDNGALSQVRARVLGPGFDMNLTMTSAGGDAWYVNRTYSALGAYTFTVWATDEGGNVGSRTGSFSIASAPPPPAPAMAMAVAQADGSILVTWSAVTSGSVSGYNVYRATVISGPFTKLTATPVPVSAPTEYVDGSVQSGVTYYYVVTAVDASGNESPNSPHASATVPATQPAPDYTIWIVLGVGAAAVVAGFAFFLRRRMKKKP